MRTRLHLRNALLATTAALLLVALWNATVLLPRQAGHQLAAARHLALKKLPSRRSNTNATLAPQPVLSIYRPAAAEPYRAIPAVFVPSNRSIAQATRAPPLS